MNPNNNQKPIDEDYIIAEYGQIYKRYKELIAEYKIDLARADFDSPVFQEINDRLCTEHNHFCAAYPLAIRYITFNMYSKNAFITWLKTLQNAKWKDHEEFLQSQATFASLLMKNLYPGYTSKDVAEYKNQLYESLLQQHNEFTATMKKKLEVEKKKIQDQEKLHIEKIRNGLKSQMSKK